MTPLLSLEAFQELLQPSDTNTHVGVWFSAGWCGPCKRIPVDRLLEKSKGVKWYIADADNNEDILEYCGVTTIPSFMLIKNGTPQPILQSSDILMIEQWLDRMECSS